MVIYRATPFYCIRHDSFTKLDGWKVLDLSLSLNGNIAVAGCNEDTYRTGIDVYTEVRHSDSRDKPKIFYSKEFEEYTADDGWKYAGRYVAFYPGSDTTILSGLGDKLEVIDVVQDLVIKSRKIKLVNHCEIKCLSVRETEIFVGFLESNKVTVYDVIDLNEIKSIILQGIQDGYYPYDMTAIADRIFVCTVNNTGESNEKSLIFEKQNGSILSELTKPTNTVEWYVESLALNITLNVIAVAWSQTYGGLRQGVDVIVFYSLLSETNCSFLIVCVEFGDTRIRISDRGDRIICTNSRTKEVEVYDMVEFLNYYKLKKTLASQLQVDDCVGLMNYLDLPKDRSEAILNSGTSSENLLSVLEERGILQPSYVDRLIEAFEDLNIHSSCYHLVDFYQRTRIKATSYDKFLASLSAHLIASLPSNLCDYFNITDGKKTSIVSSQSPGLSLLLSLDEIGIIKQSEVAALEPPFTEMKLVQAVAMIHEYQLIARKENIPMLGKTEISDEQKIEFFVRCLQRKIKSWYETMTPVPWRKSCKWSASDLFVASGLILTDSKSKRSLLDVDDKCKLESKEIFTHERLKYETRIVLEGDPGCGKTMLMSQLAYDWSQGKLNGIKLLILLPLKFVQQKTLVKAIKEFYLLEDKHLSISDIEKFLDDKSNPAHLLLDGLEEYSGNFKQETSEVNEIISRKKYPTCKVLISSRSDFAKNLPKIPMLKLGNFDGKKRSCYIEKLFPEDLKKQVEMKQILHDSPFIQDLCSVPLLFVLAVHNIENMEKSQIGQLNRVTPFVKGMVDTLCLVESLITKTQELNLGDQVQKKTSLEELALNGLCRGSQQLYWQKQFFDETIQNSREWIDSGVLVIEESTYSVPIDKNDQHEQSVDTEASDFNDSREEDNPQPGLGEVADGQSDNEKHSQMRVGEDSDKDSGERTHDTTTNSKGKEEIKSPDDNVKGVATEVGVSIAKQVPLQVRFLHKIIQEWFAAKYFSSIISKVNLDHLDKYLYERLPLINPADLHHVLRFTCALYPPSCHIIIKHLLSYRTEEGDVPEYIMNCIFLCLTEYTGGYSHNILEVVSEICMESIVIHSNDSRLLQQSKVMLLQVASSHRIKTRKLLLAELVVSAKEDMLQFNSGITMVVLETLEVIELSRWDQTLSEEDYSNILKFTAKFPMLRKTSLMFPDQPPRVDKGTAVSLKEKDQTVMWIIGSKLSQVLDPATGKWKLLGEIPTDAQKRNTEAEEKQMQQPSTSCLSGTSAGSGTTVSKSQGTQKQTQRDSIPEAGATEKLTKDFKEETPFGGVSKSQLAGCYNVQKTIITKDGGTLEIFNTGIALVIPPNALPADKESHKIQMRCIPRRTLKEPAKCFSSNSSAVVEILPDLVLQYPVRLSLPHCLVLQHNVERKATIFVRHHDKVNATSESQPFWAEQKDVSYHVEDTNCIIVLNSFSWYTYSIDDDIVAAKKLVVYAAAQKLESHDDAARIEVGCYPDLPGNDKEIQGGQNLLVAHKKILYFVKREEQCPLRISLNDIFPSGWRCQCRCGFPETHSQEIPYSKISANVRSSCVYILKKIENVSGKPLCVFTASQMEGNTAVQLAVNFQVLDKNTSTAGIMGNQCESSLKAESSITKSGGELHIKGTGVVLRIPPNALKGNAENQFVHMRIISNRIIEDQGVSLWSNS